MGDGHFKILIFLVVLTIISPLVTSPEPTNSSPHPQRMGPPGCSPASAAARNWTRLIGPMSWPLAGWMRAHGRASSHRLPGATSRRRSCRKLREVVIPAVGPCWALHCTTWPGLAACPAWKTRKFTAAQSTTAASRLLQLPCLVAPARPSKPWGRAWSFPSSHFILRDWLCWPWWQAAAVGHQQQHQ
jgi:hypothetical protein